jgi:hypothetical protein
VSSPESKLVARPRNEAQPINSEAAQPSAALLSPTAVLAAWKTLEQFWLADDQSEAELCGNDANMLGDWTA